MDYELRRWLPAGERVGAHGVLGYASYGEYVERLFGFDRRQVRERLRSVEMAWKQREAQGMVDRVRAHVGPETSASEAMRLALREGLATYAATHVGRGERCVAFEQAATHVGHPTSAGEAARAARSALAFASLVREELATYTATHVGRGERCAAVEQAATRSRRSHVPCSEARCAPARGAILGRWRSTSPLPLATGAMKSSWRCSSAIITTTRPRRSTRRGPSCARGVGWAEPVEQAPEKGVAQPSGPAASTWTGLGAILLGIAMVNLLWRGVSLPGLALLIPGAALLLRSMKR